MQSMMLKGKNVMAKDKTAVRGNNMSHTRAAILPAKHSVQLFKRIKLNSAPFPHVNTACCSGFSNKILVVY